LQRQREGVLTPAFGGVADHAQTCRWLNSVAKDPRRTWTES
jgi:hypothetical protein